MTDRQTHGQTDTTENITYPHSRVVNIEVMTPKQVPPILAIDVTVQLPSRSLHWRAVLQVILCDVTGEKRDTKDWQVGKVAAKCRDFTDYVRRCFKKLGIACEVCICMYVQLYIDLQFMLIVKRSAGVAPKMKL